MKLARFVAGTDTARFGYVHEESLVPFDSSSGAGDELPPELASVGAYLDGLPESAARAEEFVETVDETGGDESVALADARLLPPIPRPPALLDFGLSPRHLVDAALTLVRHEYGDLARRVLSPLASLAEKRLRASASMDYYKGNHHAIVGDGDTVGWPSYASYLDIEPELGLVAGTDEQPLAGYLILDDVSARDVQWSEMMGMGPARSKDFERSNGIGPFLVTPDELADPLSLDVTVDVGDRLRWRGTTAEYTHHPEQVVDYVRSIFAPRPGTIVGMGTVPGCSGLDRDTWVRPGDDIEIDFDGLGTLHQRIPEPPADRERSRWGPRSDLASR